MYRLIYILILFHRTALASIYNSKCKGDCNFPGMVCANGICKCNMNQQLFWTGARCASCPSSWVMTETACVIYQNTVSTWNAADEACRSQQAELISIRDKSTTALIYLAHEKSPHAKDNHRVWLGARAKDISGIGRYEWTDRNVKSFDSKSSLWCRKSTKLLGYDYPYDEPTKLVFDNETELCIVYWRGKGATQFLCLDDQTCSRKYPFFCEKSEYTASTHTGPPPSQAGVSSTLSITTGKPSGIDQMSSVTPTDIVNIVDKIEKPKNKSKLIIIIAVCSILGLIALIGGIFCCLAMRNRTTASKLSVDDTLNDDNKSQSDELPNQYADLQVVHPVAPPSPAIAERKNVQQSKGGGYSKQQFDEFD